MRVLRTSIVLRNCLKPRHRCDVGILDIEVFQVAAKVVVATKVCFFLVRLDVNGEVSRLCCTGSAKE
jgi:hypothetical protein